MNEIVTTNFNKIKLRLFLFPLFGILSIVLFLLVNDAFSVQGYVQIQKDWFYSINHYLGQFPTLIYNLTQFGDASIFLSFIIILIIYVPRLWESLLSALVLSLVFSRLLKDIFLVPRPAEILNHDRRIQDLNATRLIIS